MGWILFSPSDDDDVTVWERGRYPEKSILDLAGLRPETLIMMSSINRFLPPQITKLYGLLRGSTSKDFQGLPGIYHWHWIHVFLWFSSQMFKHVDELFPVLLRTLSDSSDEVVQQALVVLAEIISSPAGKKLSSSGDYSLHGKLWHYKLCSCDHLVKQSSVFIWTCPSSHKVKHV